MYLLHFLTPWEPSWWWGLLFATSSVLYLRGTRIQQVCPARQCAFWAGWILSVVVLQSRVDYYAEHEFFVHRLQHLVLHHLAPLLLMASYPGSVLWAGLPRRGFLGRPSIRYVQRIRSVQRVLKILFNPALVTLLFIVSVCAWLIPYVQFISMIDGRLYHFMNASVFITGLMYWKLILDHRPAPRAPVGAGLRVLSPILTMSPQILAGALITFSETDLYPIFELCGRAFGLPPLLDQSLGGLILWVPAGAIEALGSLIALKHWMRLNVACAAKPQNLFNANDTVVP